MAARRDEEQRADNRERSGHNSDPVEAAAGHDGIGQRQPEERDRADRLELPCDRHRGEHEKRRDQVDGEIGNGRDRGLVVEGIERKETEKACDEDARDARGP